MIRSYLLVAVGGALGSMARFWLAGAVAMLVGPAFPWGTLLVNILGSFVIGLFGALAARGGGLTVAPDVRLFVTVGLCGGFTTFSSFSLQSLELFQAGEAIRAGAYILASVALCLAFVWLGDMLGGGRS